MAIGKGTVGANRSSVEIDPYAESLILRAQSLTSLLLQSVPADDLRRQGMTSKKVPTTMGNWVQAIIRALDSEGFDGARIALEAGVPARVLRNPDARAPQPQMTAFWRSVVEVTGDPCFGLVVRRFFTPTTLGALSYGLFASPNLKSMFSRIIRYQPFVSDAVTMRFTVEAEQAKLEINTDAPDAPPFESTDVTTALIVCTTRLVSGERKISPAAVQLRRPRPPCAERFEETFRCPIEFDGRTNLLIYKRSDVEWALPDGNAELALQVDEIVSRQRENLHGDVSLQARVQQAILEALPDRPTELEVARKLCVSQSHLHRLLAAEGASFRALLNQTREEMARGYLRKGQHSIKEIAFLLGFADAATFARAFKRWTGESPRRYADTHSS